MASPAAEEAEDAALSVALETAEPADEVAESRPPVPVTWEELKRCQRMCTIRNMSKRKSQDVLLRGWLSRWHRLL